VEHILLVWVLTMGGAWEALKPWHFDTYEQCHRVVHVLMERSGPLPSRLESEEIFDIILNGKPGTGVMFADRCGSVK